MWPLWSLELNKEVYMMGLGMGEIAIICSIVFLFVGPKRLPQLARGVGESIRELQNSMKPNRKEDEKT